MGVVEGVVGTQERGKRAAWGGTDGAQGVGFLKEETAALSGEAGGGRGGGGMCVLFLEALVDSRSGKGGSCPLVLEMEPLGLDRLGCLSREPSSAACGSLGLPPQVRSGLLCRLLVGGARARPSLSKFSGSLLRCREGSGLSQSPRVNTTELWAPRLPLCCRTLTSH